MPDPTPAAQAIRQAVDAVFASSPAPPTTEEVAAAVLRAAAEQLGEEMVVIGEGFKGVTRNELSIVHVDDLLAIAAELEGNHD